MLPFPDYAQFANVSLIEDLYSRYLLNPESVDSSWRHFFEGIDFGSVCAEQAADPMQELRRYGHLRRGEDPKSVYCGPIGFEYMDLGNPELERWMQNRLEPKLSFELSAEEKGRLLESLNRAESFETFLNTKYAGQTRFSLEGAETVIPMLEQIINTSSDLGAEKMFVGMAHRGRLNVLANILHKPLALIFAEFEDDTALSRIGSDDVKYHMGFTGRFKTLSGKEIEVEMPPNPSHLESIDPVVLGQTFAQQAAGKKAAALLIHGDASVAGQGVVYESLQLMRLPAYSVGGTIHLVINNQIGYTTLPEEGRSTRYCTDIAKSFGSPVLHVNAEEPESCLFAAKLAAEIRAQFHCDVFIDLICYRKYGHNEGDEPAFTQPVQYQLIRSKKSIRHLYEEQIGIACSDLKGALQQAFSQIQKEGSAPEAPVLNLFDPFPSRIDLKTLRSVLETFCKAPAGFHLYPKLQKWLEHRLSADRIDWSTAECLAFGSLLDQGVPIRLAGQDVQRGTFGQRHMVWIDAETAKPYYPLRQYKTRSDIVNSPLTEYAGLGFEVGYSWSSPESLVLWEAQYGDFNNGAQIMIDQYIANEQHKWGIASSLTLLLPHGYEGAGPEHSSARLERFLQLAACNNIQIVNASTPAQYFHLLRRQALRKVKIPLVVFTPKSLLRNPACTSAPEELTQGQFEEVLDDPAPPQSAKRLIVCSGKIFYDLLAARKRGDIAIIRLEQLYPLCKEKLQKLMMKYKGFTECFWVQEEPENMGAWNYIRPFLPNGTYVGRPPNATSATGSSRKHKQEQQMVIEKAIT